MTIRPSTRTNIPNYEVICKNLIATLVYDGVNEIDTKKLGAGLEAAIIEAGKRNLFVSGISELTPERFLQIGLGRGFFDAAEVARGQKVRIIGFKNKEEALEYLTGHTISEERRKDYFDIGKVFRKGVE